MGKEHWLQLALADGIGPITLKRLIDAAGSAEAACTASLSTLRSIEGVGTSRADQIRAGMQSAATQVPDQLQRCEALGAQIICLDDDLYPALLKTIHDPPPVLFVRGTLEPRDMNALAIVGSRGCSFYGREQAQRFAASLAGIGFTIISGGARGIDSAAHHGALSHPAGRTISILGCGVDLVYPPENTALFDQIVQRGAVISEYPLGTQPLAENFPRRNRIVSGLSRGIFVIEAAERSGALITAHTACEQNRPVFALPGRVDNKLSSGPHQLIREGATLVTMIQDIVESLPPVPQELQNQGLFDPAPSAPAPTTAAAAIAEPAAGPKPSAALNQLSAEQSQIFTAIEDATSVDLVVERSGLPVHIVLRELTMLSLKGLIRRVDGQTYTRGKA